MFINIAKHIINAHTTSKKGYSTHYEMSNTLNMFEFYPLRHKI
jgi:hypothetical protein